MMKIHHRVHLLFIPSPLLILLSCLLVPDHAGAIQDRNGNGMSDVFERRFNAGDLFSATDPRHAPGADPDGDGYTTEKEALTGTNPFDAKLPDGWLRTTLVQNPASAASFTLSFPSIEGKLYRLGSSADLLNWIDHPEAMTGTGNVIQLAINAALEDSEGIPERLFWRVKITDLDEDRDQLTHWEELALGLDPLNADSDGDGFRDDTDSNPSLNPYASDPDGYGLPAGLTHGLIGRWDFETVLPRPNPADTSLGFDRFPDSTPNARHGGSFGVLQEPLGMPSKGANHQRGFIGIAPSLLTGRPVYSVSLWAKLPSDAIGPGYSAAALFSNHTVQTSGMSSRRYVNALYITLENGVETLRAGSYLYNTSPVVNSVSGVAIPAPPGAWTDDKWHHYLYVCNDATVALYRDGVLLGQTLYTPADISPNATLSGVSVGRFYGPALGTVPFQQTNTNGILKGRIDRLRVWSRALNGDDADALYQEDVSGDGIDDRRAVESRLWRDRNSDTFGATDEYPFVLDPFIHYTDQDSDGDGLSNLAELVIHTDPAQSDTDRDMMPDGWEAAHGLDPTESNGAHGAAGNPDGDASTNLDEYREKSDPQNPASSGPPDPPGGDAISIKLGVGDRSGSESEDYTMECFEFDPVTNTEKPVYTLRSGGFGQYAEQVVSNVFHAGRNYTFQLKWQGSTGKARPAGPPGGDAAEGPDFDYHFVVEPQGNHGAMITDGYDIRAGKTELGRMILDPQDIEPGNDDDDNIPDLPNYFGHIRVVLRTLLGGKLITPAGDPVAAPVEGGDGANEFIFTDASPGILQIELKAKPADGLPFDPEIANKFKFQLDIPGSDLTWSTGNEDGKARKQGAFLVATATFTGLPENNTSFGARTARLMAEGRQCDSKQFEVFFPKNATNHPGGQTGSPNWYHYWMQTSANHTNTTTEFRTTSISGRSEYLFTSHTIILLDDCADTSIIAWGTPTGIDAFAWVTAHEAKHHAQYSSFWPNGWIAANDQTDKDGIPSDIEPIYMPGRPYKPDEDFTFPDDIGYNDGAGYMIRDIEDICMRSQTAAPNGAYPLDKLWINGSADAADWANPGKNSKKRF